MARRCVITGKGVQVGNNVSHANNKTRRRFMPNMQVVSLLSQLLGRSVRLRMSVHGLRTVEHRGGLDAWLLSSPDRCLDPDMLRLKRTIDRVRTRKEAA